MASDILKNYSYYLRVERGMSSNTVSSYCSDVKAFMAWMSSLGGHGSLAAVDSEDIAAFLADHSSGLSKRSQSRELSALTSFFDWLVLEGERKDNPCDRVDSPKIGRYLPAVLSVEEVGAIIDGVDTRDPKGIRDKAILEILYGCGL